MSFILLGLGRSSISTSGLTNELKDLGYDLKVVNSGYDVIREAVLNRPAAIILHVGLVDCDVIRTSMWLTSNKGTSEIPQFLVQRDNKNATYEDWKFNGATDTLCNFKGRFTQDSGVEGIASAIKAYADAGGFSVPDSELGAEPPSKEVIQKDLVEVFESQYIKSRLLLQLLQVNRNINEMDYFAKVLMEHVASMFECELVSFLWKGEDVTEYDLITAPIELGMFEALRRVNQATVRESGWGGDGPTDLITWGRQHISNGGEEMDAKAFASLIEKVDIVFRGDHRGTLILVSKHGSPGLWDSELVTDFKNHLGPVFSNFVMYQDLELNLLRDDRIFQSIGELAGVSTLELENFRSFLLQSLLILLDLYSTNKGAIVIIGSDGCPAETLTLGESEDYFLFQTSGGESIIDRAVKEPRLYAYAHEASSEKDIEQLDDQDVENIVIAPLNCGYDFFGLVILANIRPFNMDKERKSITTFAKLVSNHIHNKNLSDEYIDKKSIEEQLTLAREIQMGLLPPGEMQNKAYDIYAKSVPAKQVGGDFFDYYPIDEEWLGLSIADISGKGIPASLLMSMTKTLFQSLFETHRHPADVLSKANNILVKQFFSDKFVTALFGLLIPGRLVLASGGHHPLIVYRAAEDSFEEIDPDGIALGIIEDAIFEVAEVEIKPGDVGVFFTDGLCESANSAREQFGYKRIEEIVRAKSKDGAKALVDALFAALEEHTEGMPAFDDTTVIVIVAKSEDGYAEDG